MLCMTDTFTEEQRCEEQIEKEREREERETAERKRENEKRDRESRETSERACKKLVAAACCSAQNFCISYGVACIVFVST